MTQKSLSGWGSQPKTLGSRIIAAASALTLTMAALMLPTAPASANGTVSLENTSAQGASFTVPQGVTSLNVMVAGTSGGEKVRTLLQDSGAGGSGALIIGSLTVSPGDLVTYYGSTQGGDSGNNGAGGKGGLGYRNGGDGGAKTSLKTNLDRAGGGGGGASAVLINGTPAVIAGGGGGGGGGSNFHTPNMAVTQLGTNALASGYVTITYTVQPLNTTLTGEVSDAKVLQGSEIEFAVSAPGGVVNTGHVTVAVNGESVRIPVTNGVAQGSIAHLPVGQHNYTATYTDELSKYASSQKTGTVTISKWESAVTIVSANIFSNGGLCYRLYHRN